MENSQKKILWISKGTVNVFFFHICLAKFTFSLDTFLTRPRISGIMYHQIDINLKKSSLKENRISMDCKRKLPGQNIKMKLLHFMIIMAYIYIYIYIYMCVCVRVCACVYVCVL